MQLTKKYALFAAPVVLLLLATASTNIVYAWDGPYSGYGPGIGNGGYFYPQPYENGYSAGIADAVYDHDNNLAYNPIAQCVPCHSQDYWDNFKQGYDQQWSSYTSQSQEQSSTQDATINIYGNNYGTASIGQSNTQGQSATAGLPQLIGQGLCHLGLQSSCGYSGGYPTGGGGGP